MLTFIDILRNVPIFKKGKLTNVKKNPPFAIYLCLDFSSFFQQAHVRGMGMMVSM